jgi:hypothetical protein
MSNDLNNPPGQLTVSKNTEAIPGLVEQFIRRFVSFMDPKMHKAENHIYNHFLLVVTILFLAEPFRDARDVRLRDCFAFSDRLLRKKVSNKSGSINML